MQPHSSPLRLIVKSDATLPCPFNFSSFYCKLLEEMFGKFLKSRVKLSVPMVDVTRAPLLADSGSSSISSRHGWLTWCFLDGTCLLIMAGFLASSVQPTSLLQFRFAPAIGTFHSRMEGGYHLKVVPMFQSLWLVKPAFPSTPSRGLSGV